MNWYKKATYNINQWNSTYSLGEKVEREIRMIIINHMPFEYITKDNKKARSGIPLENTEIIKKYNEEGLLELDIILNIQRNNGIVKEAIKDLMSSGEMEEEITQYIGVRPNIIFRSIENQW